MAEWAHVSPSTTAGPAFTGHGVVLSTDGARTTVTLYNVSITHEQGAGTKEERGAPAQGVLIGTSHQDESIYNPALNDAAVTTIVHYLLAEAHKMLVNGGPGAAKTVPVFVAGALPEAGNRPRLVKAVVNNGYYGAGHRFQMYLGDADADGRTGVSVDADAALEKLKAEFRLVSERIAILFDSGYPEDKHPKLIIYRHDSIKNIYFNLQPRTYKIEVRRGMTYEERIETARSYDCRNFLISKDNKAGKANLIAGRLPEEQICTCDHLRSYEEALDEVSKHFGYTKYGAIMDAGSSGTRIYVYKWTERFTADGTPVVPKAARSGSELQELGKHRSDADGNPYGLSQVEPDDVPRYLGSLLQYAKQLVANEIQAAIDSAELRKVLITMPLYIYATGGMRSLQRENYPRYIELRGAVTNYLNDSGFLEPTYDTISGNDEGIYGWVAANWEERVFNNTTGATMHYLEMGGETAQLAFAPERQEDGAVTNYTGPLVRLQLGSRRCEIFVKCWPKLGADAMWNLHEVQLRKSGARSDPCWPKEVEHSKGVEGTADIVNCTQKTFQLLQCPDSGCKVGRICLHQPHGPGGCLLHGVPDLGFSAGRRLLCSSVFWKAFHGLYAQRDDTRQYSTGNLWERCEAIFARRWRDLIRHADTPDDSRTNFKYLRFALFKAGLVTSTLHFGFGVPLSPYPHIALRLAAGWGIPIETAQDEGYRPTNGILMIDTIASLISPDALQGQQHGRLQVILSRVFGSFDDTGERVNAINDILDGPDITSPAFRNALTYLRDNAKYFPKSRCEAVDGDLVPNQAYITLCVGFIQKCPVAPPPQEQFQIRDTNWALGRMLLRAVNSEPEALTFHSWRAPVDPGAI